MAKFTAAFQELGNCYQRVLKYIIDRLQSHDEDLIEPMNDEAVFTKEHFDKFNFPFENRGSFTVGVEDNLAELWQDCLEKTYGKPQIVINEHNTECDRMWKLCLVKTAKNIDITVHFYNHNKPKDKKQSLLLIQGAFQSIICEYVFS